MLQDCQPVFMLHRSARHCTSRPAVVLLRWDVRTSVSRGFLVANGYVRLFLFLVFFPRDQALPSNTGVPQYTWRSAVTVAFISLAHGFLTIIFSAWLVISKPDYLLVWANVLGITAAILAAIQYFPQIWTTYRLQHVGSLSIPMMLIQTPGSFVWAGSLAARLGIEGWSTWGVYLITGSLQGCLLALGIYFEYQARKAGIDLGSEVR